jgi:DNA invertase Pin-like site-specific DNA recombinase
VEGVTQDERATIPVLGVSDDRIYGDHGLTCTNRHRTGLRLALAACWAGDTLVVTKLGRLARSLPDAPDLLDGLTKRNVKLTSSAAQAMIGPTPSDGCVQRVGDGG